MMNRIKIGTRRSIMARAQCQIVGEHLKLNNAELELEEVIVLSSGDKKQGTEAANCGDKRDWIDGFEDALQDNKIDFAVHCGKDVPVDIAADLQLSSVLGRWSPFDVFIGRKLSNGTRIKFKDLPAAAIIGTASLRRKAELLRLDQIY